MRDQNPEIMTETTRIDRFQVSVGGLSRAELRSALTSRGILLNEHAETLLDSKVFGGQVARVITVDESTVAALGCPDGATLPEIFKLAREQGLLLCPADAGPYLRLALNDQVASADSVMSAGKAPDGAVTIASELLSDDVQYPKGFYLRVVDGQAWLRGYRCDDEYVFSAADRFVFQAPAPSP
ncbi:MULTISPECIES: hypothetical protein [unclassified Microbacterium]|uniref:hypothetical protein n=1 Tax=unclassified Microbacterium TaxID=2609290 RepID=UPI00214B273C|nr:MULTISPECIES: hypothetical protein [unclassified Microbacterium]MCR2786098.1 hypothetical protein [Microbacterium sp. zg.B96]WIM17053.1 hypothetical protein QNO11_05300 [Microbacterium sp. zg-B96]